MWKFKPSKYKNAVPKSSKKREDCVTDISVGLLPSFGNHIKSSAALVAFNIDQEGQGNLGTVPLSDFGNNKSLSILHAHSGFVTDFDFCPYDDYILATGAEDCHVKIWRINSESLSNQALYNPLLEISLHHRIEAIKFHPQADCILTVAESTYIRLWDVNAAKFIYSNSELSSTVQSIAWRHSGEILGSCGQDKKLRIWDPRDPSKNQVVTNHYSNKDTRIVWLGDSDQLITTGLGSERQREVFLRDIRNLTEPVATYSGDTSLKTYIPLHDPDTNMLFLIAQADHAVMFCEIVEHAPYIQEAAKHLCDNQVFGAALVPKRALHFMDAEVNRLLLLGKDSVVPLSYQVPRKSYRNFHDDLFPDTFAPIPSLTASQWQAGEKSKIHKITINPNETSFLIQSNHCLGSGPQEQTKSVSNKNFANSKLSEEPKQNLQQTSNKVLKPAISPKPALKSKPVFSDKKSKDSFNENKKSDIKDECATASEKLNNKPVTEKKRIRTFGARSSKFRHLNAVILPKEHHITDLASLTRTMPGESDGFDANVKRVAVPVGTGGNFLAILELAKPGRAPAAADMPGVLCGASIMDFCWDPFDNNRIAVACDNGNLQIWIVQDNLSEKLEEPEFSLRGHTDKINCIKFHPCAKDVIASASSDLSIRIWDLSTREQKYSLTGHTDQILCIAWNPVGSYIASVSKDQKIRIFNARNASEPVKEGIGPQGMRGARMVWVLDGTHLAVSGFSKVSERQIYLYDYNDISNPIEDISLDVSPATLIPFYDDDSSTLFLSGKGDAIIYAYEISKDSPHFHPLSHYKCIGPHQALSFLPKYVCDVRKVEFAQAIRLTASVIEPISFHVPRLRIEYFQDDLFPPTATTWIPSMTSNEWFSGENKPLNKIDLKPDDMIPLSKAPAPSKPESKPPSEPVNIAFEGEVNFESSLAFLQSGKEKEEKIVQSMMSKCELQESDLPQEQFEGVDPSEWDE